MSTKVKRIAITALGVVVLLLLILYLGGFFAVGQIGPDDVSAGEPPTRVPEHTGTSSRTTVTEWYEAVGTLEAETRTRVESRITARIVDINVAPGDRVSEGDLLVALDTRQAETQVTQAEMALEAAETAANQARHGLESAQAARQEAESQYRRIQGFVNQQAATERDLEASRAAFLQAQAAERQAEAGVQRAQSETERAAAALQEARIVLGYAEIRAPASGRIAEKPVDSGDLARPGKPLLYLESDAPLRLRALIPASLLAHISLGLTIPVKIDALQKRVEATLVEIVPSADPRSHTFTVKARLLDREGLYSGMFGRLIIEVGSREAVIVPRQAIRTIGQLDLVTVKQGQRWITVPVVTGSQLEEGMEILSGLEGNETVALTGGNDG